MLIKSVLVGLVSVLGVVDSRLIGRQNLSRPLILSSLVGLVLGDLTTGVMLGASLELIAMGMVGIGAAAPPNMQIGSVIATSFTILTGASTESALAIAIPVAVAAEFIGIVMRMIIAQFAHVADRRIEEGNFAAARRIHIGWSFTLNALLYFVPVFLAVYAGVGLVQGFVDAIPDRLTAALSMAGSMLTALGFAMLLSTMLSRKLVPYFLLGFFVVAYTGLDLIAVTLMGAFVAFVMDKQAWGTKEAR